jgi:hypothetical protein
MVVDYKHFRKLQGSVLRKESSRQHERQKGDIQTGLCAAGLEPVGGRVILALAERAGTFVLGILG